jgi:hypothetical protein
VKISKISLKTAPLCTYTALMSAGAAVADGWTGTQADQMISFDEDEYARGVRRVGIVRL